MKRFFIRGVVFLVVSAAAIHPLMRLAEIAWTRDVSADPPSYFPVLARSSQGKFMVVRFRNPSAQSSPVLEIADQDLEPINRDLTSSVSPTLPTYSYFRILERRPAFIDVALIVPTKGDFWSRSQYRIQNGVIYPQRITNYGPAMAFFVGPLSLLAGVFGVWLCERVGRRFRTTTV